MLTDPSFQPRQNVQPGLAPRHLAQAASLYWQAFGPEILPFRVAPCRGESLIRHALRPQMALVALTADGDLAALAGVRDETGGLLDGAVEHFRAVWGGMRGRAIWLASQLYRGGPATSDMVLDGVVVAPQLRGQGYGQALIAAAADLAARGGYSGLRAEVSGTNHAARQLYLSLGFRPAGRGRMGWPWDGQADIMRFEALGADTRRSCPSPAPAR